MRSALPAVAAGAEALAGPPVAVRPRSAWSWLPTLYFAQAIPYAVVMSLSVVFYKRLEVSNTDIALYTSWLYLPWVIKPLWSPLVELLSVKRHWIVVMQALVGTLLAMVALAVPVPAFFQWTLAMLWLAAFASATHDIAADGFYMLALSEREQAAFVGVRSACFRLGLIAAQGGLVMLAGGLEQRLGQPRSAWAIVFGVTGALFVALALLHRFTLPRPALDRPADRTAASATPAAFIQVFLAFFRRPGLAAVLSFLLLYRLGEAQLLKLATPFLLDSPAQGGLGLATQQVGLVYGAIGAVCLTAGGLLGGWLIARRGLARCLWPMLLAIHGPNLLFVALAWHGPAALPWVALLVALEQFGYGFGFAAYLVFMLWVAGGVDGANPHRTAHYALCTGFMALGMMLPGMWSGWLQAQLGYLGFFIAASLATLPSFVVVARTRLDPAFGRRSTEAAA